MRLEYQVFDATGDLFESSADGGPVETVVGSGELPLGIDNALPGLEVGAKLDLTLAGEDAFGEIDPDRIETVPRAEFPEADNFTVGESVELQFEGEEGESEEEIPRGPDHRSDHRHQPRSRDPRLQPPPSRPISTHVRHGLGLRSRRGFHRDSVFGGLERTSPSDLIQTDSAT